MITVITIFIIVYACSLTVMAIFATISEAWGYDRKIAVTCVFAPIINTLVLCLGVFYIIPSDIYKQHKDKEKLKHKHDPRWNLMNNRKNE